MALTKRIVIPIAAAAVGITILSAGAVAMAASNSQPGTLAQKLATTFHLDAGKVQGVIDQNRTEHQAAREQKYEDRLNHAVANGKLTPAQKNAVLAEHNKLKSELAGAKDLSPADRRALMQKVHSEAQTWAQQNHLSARWLGTGAGGFGGRHMHPMMGAPSTGPSPSPSA